MVTLKVFFFALIKTALSCEKVASSYDKRKSIYRDVHINFPKIPNQIQIINFARSCRTYVCIYIRFDNTYIGLLVLLFDAFEGRHLTIHDVLTSNINLVSRMPSQIFINITRMTWSGVGGKRGTLPSINRFTWELL